MEARIFDPALLWQMQIDLLSSRPTFSLDCIVSGHPGLHNQTQLETGSGGYRRLFSCWVTRAYIYMLPPEKGLLPGTPWATKPLIPPFSYFPAFSHLNPYSVRRANFAQCLHSNVTCHWTVFTILSESVVILCNICIYSIVHSYSWLLHTWIQPTRIWKFWIY